MKKTVLEAVERAITVAILASSCMGFTLFGWFFLRLVMEEVTESHLWNVFIVGVILTYALQRLLTFVGMEIMEIEAEELEFKKDAQAAELYEHLEVR